MKTVTVKPNQTIFDITCEQYGTCEAVQEILRLNPGIRNDPAALAALGVDYLAGDVFYIDVPVAVDFPLQIDTDSRTIKTSVTKEINTEITTFIL